VDRPSQFGVRSTVKALDHFGRVGVGLVGDVVETRWLGCGVGAAVAVGSALRRGDAPGVADGAARPGRAEGASEVPGAAVQPVPTVARATATRMPRRIVIIGAPSPLR